LHHQADTKDEKKNFFHCFEQLFPKNKKKNYQRKIYFQLLKVAYSPLYAHPLPDGHRFPMKKYELLPEQLLYEGTIKEEQLFTPTIVAHENLLQAHDLAYLNKLENLQLSLHEIRRIGFPLSKELVLREKTIMQGSIACCEFALKNKISLNIAGGTHHAFRDCGEGFCLLNDLAIAAYYLLQHHPVKRILIIDLDVHQGNGTAAIFQHEERVFTFSMHGEKNFPGRKEKSNLDVALKDGTDDKTYLSLLDFHLQQILDSFQPDFLLYQSGVDILESDQLGRINVSLEGCKQRDRMVFEAALHHKIPLAGAMGGGYSKDLKTILEAHANTFRLAMEVFF
jgi:acetoin utilization deacetylase AcuC-like enzyme